MANKFIYLGVTPKTSTTHTYTDVSMVASNSSSDLDKLTVSELVDIKSIQNSLHNIFVWQQGERVLEPDFGSRLRKYLYEGISEYNQSMIINEIRNAVSKFEPRVSITEVYDGTTTQDKETNTVRLDIYFTVPTLADKTFVFQYAQTRTDT